MSQANCRHQKKSTQPDSNRFEDRWSEMANMIIQLTVFFIIDYTNITNRLFLRGAIFIKISEAIVDVECSDIFDAVVCECNELPCIGLEFT